MLNFIAVVVTTLIVIASLGFSTLLFRYRVRNFQRSRREGRIGKMVWYELRPGRTARSILPQGERFKHTYTDSIVSSLSSDVKNDMTRFRRQTISAVWRFRPREGLKLYIGVTQGLVMRDGSAEAVSSIASGIGATVHRLEEPMELAVNTASVAVRKEFHLPEEETRVTPGGVAERLNELISGGAPDEETSVIMTFDNMQNYERLRTSGFAMSESQIGQGFNAAFASKGAAELAQGARTSVAAVSSSSDSSFTRGVLTSALDKITTKGLYTTVLDTEDMTARITKVIAVSFIGIGILFAIIAPATIAQKAVVLTFSLFPHLLFLIPFFNQKVSGDPLKKWLRKGESVVPGYVNPWWNPRFKLRAWYQSMRHVAGSDKDSNKNLAPPSCAQVIPMSKKAMAEFVSFPDGPSSSFTMNAVPAVGMNSKRLSEAKNGAYLGKDGLNQEIVLDYMTMHLPLYVAGRPESGKTNLLHVIWCGIVFYMIRLHKFAPVKLSFSPIWTETKSDGAYDAWRAAKNHPGARFIDTMAPDSPYRLTLEGRRISEGATVKEVTVNAQRFVSAMQFAWGDGIRGASRDVLTTAATTLLLLSPKEVQALGILKMTSNPNPKKFNLVNAMRVILGIDPNVQVNENLISLHEEIGSEIEDKEKVPPRRFALYEQMTSLLRFTRAKNTPPEVSSTFNKLSVLAQADHIFDPREDREDVSPYDLVHDMAPDVVNFGPHNPDPENASHSDQSSMDSSLSKRLLKMYSYLTWETVRTTCNGWQKIGRRVPFFADELADLAFMSENDDVTNVTQAQLTEGRSRGFALMLGSQNLEQLPEKLSAQLMNIAPSKLWHTVQGDGLRMALNDLSSGDDTNNVFSGEDVRTLTTGVSVGRLAIISREGNSKAPKTMTSNQFALQAIKYDDILDAYLKAGSYEDLMANIEEIEGRFNSGEDEDGTFILPHPVVEVLPSDVMEYGISDSQKKSDYDASAVESHSEEFEMLVAQSEVKTVAAPQAQIDDLLGDDEDEAPADEDDPFANLMSD